MQAKHTATVLVVTVMAGLLFGISASNAREQGSLAETDLAQRLQPVESRVKRIEVAQVEDIVAKIARIPPKHVSVSDKSCCATLSATCA